MHSILRALLFTFLVLTLSIQGGLAQLQVTAGAPGESAYTVLAQAGVGIEGPDNSSAVCASGSASNAGNHKAFGEHIVHVADEVLAQNVFGFISHLDEDSDRCVTFDRVRMEIKGGPSGSTDERLEHAFGDTSIYRWQFKLDEGFIGSSSFTHLFQNKAQGGTNGSFPVLTLTARSAAMELIHAPADDGSTAVDLATVPLAPFRGNWVEVYMRQVHTDNGLLEVRINDVVTGAQLLAYESSDIDLWRETDRAQFINRPKWGVYRSIRDGLRDETVLFGNFCVAETETDVCPSLLPTTGGVPGAVVNTLPLNGVSDVPQWMPLVWDAASEADSYTVYFGTSEDPDSVGTTSAPTFMVELAEGTTYYYQIEAVNAIGSTISDVSSFTTLDSFDDGTWEVVRGHAPLHIEASEYFELNTNLEVPPAVDEVRIIGDQGDNAAYCFLSAEKEDNNSNYRWRYRQEEGEPLTVVMRLAALPANNNITYVEFYGLGWRQKVRINRSTAKFERTPEDPEFAFPDGYWDDGAFHVLRFTFAQTEGGNMLTSLYLDEAEEAFASGASDEQKDSNYLDIGRAGGTNYGACFDYVAINPTGVFAPSDDMGANPPGDLVGTRGTAVSPPGVVTHLRPLSGAQNVPLSMPLVWQASDDALEYNVYFGTDPNPPLVGDTTGLGYQPALEAATTYYYQIGAVNGDGEALTEVYSFSTLTDADDGEWDVARGHARPEVEVPALFEFNTNLEDPPALDTVKLIDEAAGEAAFCYLSGPKEGSNNNYRWRYRQPENAVTTVLVRMAALPDNSNLAYIEFFGLGWRQKLRLNTSTVKFERTPEDPEFAFPDGFWDDGAYHTIRITYAPTDGGNMLTTLYLDEMVMPFAQGESDESNDNTYLEVGRAGGTDYGACFDFIAVNAAGAFAPGSTDEAASVPGDLNVPESNGTVSVDEYTDGEQSVLSLAPNPVSQRLDVLGLSESPFQYRVLSATGQVLLTGQVAATSTTLDVSVLPKGVYVLYLSNANKAGQALRFIKQ